ncbi:MAG: MBL fold metallo-hydrolase [Pseudomonadota bacterium]
MTRRLTCRLLGTGSSGGVPRIDGNWGVCDPNEPKNRRRRCSILISAHDLDREDAVTRVLIDTSPDLREQLLDARVSDLDALVFTHDHADQTHGIDDIRALVYRRRKPLLTYLDVPTSDSLVPKFNYVFEGAGDYPPILDRQPYIEPLVPFTLTGAGGDIDLLPVEQEHGRIRSLGFRAGSLAYCNDLNALPEQSLAALMGLDIFIVDALRYTPHPSHANVDQALDWVKILKPKRTILTNLHVDLDYQTLLNELPASVEPGYDGMEITLEIAN